MKKSREALPTLPCACASLRRASRVVTRLYNNELRPSQLELTQFTLLMTLHQTGEITQKVLGKFLAMDSTTLTRTLRPLLTQHWIITNPGKDRREKLLSLTPAGRQKFEDAKPGWERAQAKLKARVGADLWSEMAHMLGKIAMAA